MATAEDLYGEAKTQAELEVAAALQKTQRLQQHLAGAREGLAVAEARLAALEKAGPGVFEGVAEPVVEDAGVGVGGVAAAHAPTVKTGAV
ncbi:MAG: hypothetical protein L0H84_00860 [Pseudonocardia sp.]|nr:hypothetical protein [Pseudonocardia sp.]